MSNNNLLDVMQTIPFANRQPFAFYYNQATNQNLPIEPEYTWDQFEQNGYAPFLETEQNTLASFDELADKLIPNTRTWHNQTPPMLTAFMGRPIEGILKAVDAGELVFVNSAHPTLASPIPVTRAIIEAAGPQIREKLFVVYGGLPTVFRYNLGGEILSPVGIARSLGNVMLTAAKTPSNETTNASTELWQNTQRAVFKDKLSELSLNGAGAIIVLCVTGQRVKKGHVLRPDGHLNYLHGHKMWNVGIHDDLLGPELISPVWLQVDPAPLHVKSDAEVHQSNRRTCELSNHDNVKISYESHFDQTRRVIWPRKEASAKDLKLG